MCTIKDKVSIISKAIRRGEISVDDNETMKFIDEHWREFKRKDLQILFNKLLNALNYRNRVASKTTTKYESDLDKKIKEAVREAVSDRLPPPLDGHWR